MPSPTTKDIAEYLRLALEVGLCSDYEVESWADIMIVKTDSPTPEWLLNLSIDRKTSKNRSLKLVPGAEDKGVVWNLLLARLGIGYQTKHFNPEQIIRMLFRWAVNREIPKPFFQDAYRLDDEFDLMKEGIISKDRFIKGLEDFFTPFRSFESLLPQLPLPELK